MCNTFWPVSVWTWQYRLWTDSWYVLPPAGSYGMYKTLVDHIKCLGWLGSRRFSLYVGGLRFKYRPGDRLTWLSVFTAFVSFFSLTLIQNDAIPLLSVDAAPANEISPPPLWHCGPTRAMAFSFLRFLDHTQRRITVGRTPLDEWSARRRDLYLTTRKHSQQTNIHVPGGIRTHNLSRRAAADLRLFKFVFAK